MRRQKVFGFDYLNVVTVVSFLCLGFLFIGVSILLANFSDFDMSGMMAKFDGLELKQLLIRLSLLVLAGLTAVAIALAIILSCLVCIVSQAGRMIGIALRFIWSEICRFRANRLSDDDMKIYRPRAMSGPFESA